MKKRHRRHHPTHTYNAVPHKTRAITPRQHPAGSSRSPLYAPQRTTVHTTSLRQRPAGHLCTRHSPHHVAQAAPGRSPLYAPQCTTPRSQRVAQAGHLCTRRSALQAIVSLCEAAPGRSLCVIVTVHSAPHHTAGSSSGASRQRLPVSRGRSAVGVWAVHSTAAVASPCRYMQT